jgi:hypothetical protein
VSQSTSIARCGLLVKQRKLFVDIGTILFQNIRRSKKILAQYREKLCRAGSSISDGASELCARASAGVQSLVDAFRVFSEQ